jgi:hypothetical protein
LNGPEKAADMDDMLNAQTADPGMLLLNKQNLIIRNEETP